MQQIGGLEEEVTAKCRFILKGGDEVILHLPVVHPLYARTLIDHLDPDYRSITLDIEYPDFSIIAYYLKTKKVPKRTMLLDEDKFIHTCDYLGLGGLFKRVTSNFARVYENVLTPLLLLDRTREEVARQLHRARVRREGPPQINQLRCAKLSEQYGSPGFCETIDSVCMGLVMFELPLGYSTPLTEQEFTSRYQFPVVDSLEVPRPNWVEDPAQIIANLNKELPGFPWQDLVLAGSSILSAAASPETRVRYHQSDYDFFVTAGTQCKGQMAICRVAAWIKSRYGPFYMVAATEQAVSFFTEKAVYQIILRLYGTPEDDDSASDALLETDRLHAIEHVLTGFDIAPCSLGFDGAQLWAIPRAVEAIRSNVILADPERESRTMVKRLLKYATRGFMVAFPGLMRDTYARLIRMRGVRGAEFGHTIVEQFIQGKCEKVSGDYSPEFHPIKMRATSWASREQCFQMFINEFALRFLYSRNVSIRVFTRQIDVVLNTPAGVSAEALSAWIRISHPDSVYVAPNAPASGVVFIWQHSHDQKHALSGSFNPCSSVWFPGE
jgi:hypothetical protein